MAKKPVPKARMNCDGSVTIPNATIKALTKRTPDADFSMVINGKRTKVRVFSNCAP